MPEETKDIIQVNDKRFQEMPSEDKAVVPVQQDNSPASMMAIALDKGVDIARIEKMLELQEKWEAREALKAYNDAMAKFKANPPVIEKDRKVSYKAGGGTTEYNHASLANATEKINTELSKYGLSATWKTDQPDGIIKVTCTITHCLGHSESTSLQAASDTSGGKNAIQAIGSTISYLERYTLFALTGLASKDMDDDGAGAGKQPEYITEDQVKIIDDLVKESGSDEAKFMEWLEIEKYQDIKTSQFNEAKLFLESKIRNKKKNADNN